MSGSICSSTCSKCIYRTCLFGEHVRYLGKEALPNDIRRDVSLTAKQLAGCQDSTTNGEHKYELRATGEAACLLLPERRGTLSVGPAAASFGIIRRY